MPLKVRFLTKCHTEKRRGRRIIKTKQWKSRRHRRCIERWSLFAHFFSNFMAKHLFPKLLRICTLYLRRSLCHWHLRDIAFTSVPSVTPCAYYIRLLVYHSIFRKNHKYAFTFYSLTVLLIQTYPFSHIYLLTL